MMITLFHSLNNIEKKSFLERKIKLLESVSSECNRLIKNISFIHQSAQNIYVNRAIRDNYQCLPKKIDRITSLIPCSMDNPNAKSYISLKSCSMPIISNMGVMLNNEGDLIFTQGYRRNFFSCFNKRHKIKKQKYYTVDLKGEQVNIKFDELHINKNGKLIAKVKDDNIYYSITFTTSSSISTEEISASYIGISYEKQSNTLSDDLSFKINDNKTVSFNFYKNKLYIKSYSNEYIKYEYDLMGYNIKIFKNKNHKIKSIKRCIDHLQIEVFKGKETIIYYLNPKDINLHRLRAKIISEKPPKSIDSNLSSIMHKNYNNGQPFTSTKRVKVNTPSIFFIYKIKKTTHSFIEKTKSKRSKTQKIISGLKCTDPGINTAKSVIKDLIKKSYNNISNASLAENIITDIKKNLTSLTNQSQKRDYKSKSPSNDILSILQSLNEKDAIVLSKKSELSIFFSVLQHGLPFQSGWFSGSILSIVKTHCIILTKSENGNIKITLSRKKKISLSMLAGTGQGFESTIYRRKEINLFSIMPFEANIMLSIQKSNEFNFSFTLTMHQLESLLNHPAKHIYQEIFSGENNNIVNKEHISEYGVSLSLDMKISELRAVLGAHNNAHMSFLSPRLACGVGANATILSFNNKKVKKFSDEENQPKVENQKTMRLLSGTGNFYAGEKYILSLYTTNDEERFSYRLVLIETGDSVKGKTKCAFKYKKTKDKHGAIPQLHNEKQFKKAYKMLATIREEIEIIRPMHKISHLKIIRSPYKRTKYFSKKKSIKPRSKFQFKNKINNIYDSGKPVEPFADSIKRIATHASNKNINTSNNKLRHDISAKYSINSDDQKKLRELKAELDSLERKKVVLNHSQEKETLMQLQRRIKKIKNDAKYQLRSIELYSIGEMIQTKSSLTNVLLNFRQTKTQGLIKNLGQISLEYADTETPSKISGNYRFF